MLKLLVACVALAASSAQSGFAAGLSDADRAALTRLDQDQVQNWLRGDQAGVMNSVTDDIVFIPHHGVAPKIGKAALETFWFPAGSPPLKIDEYWHKITAIEPVGNNAIIYGRQLLVYEWQGDRVTVGEGNYFILAVRHSGAWKMRYLVVTDPPNKVEHLPKN